MNRIVVAGALGLGFMAAAPAVAADASRGAVLAQPPGTSSPPLSGYLEVYGNVGTQTYWGSPYNPWYGLGGAGRANVWLSPTKSFQLDFQGNALVSTYDSYAEYEVATFAHLSHRNDRHLFGVFGGLSLTNDDEYYYWQLNGVAGVEAQKYFGNVTLYAQTGVFHTLMYYSYPTTMWYANAELRWFVQPNLKLAANIGYSSGELFGSAYGNYNFINYGAEIEHKFGGSPLTVFARWDGVGYYGYHDNIFKGGVRLMLNQPTLLAQDRNGATLKVDNFPIIWMKGSDY